jgi:hypothetical protein
MSGGDYDGDDYLVIYGNSDFVTGVQCVSPYEENAVDSISPPKKVIKLENKENAKNTAGFICF